MGGSNQSLIASYFGLEGLVNGTAFFAAHGDAAVTVSYNGGQSWSGGQGLNPANWPGQNASWSTSSSPTYGDVLSGMDITSTFYGLNSVYPSVALNNSDPSKGMTLISPYGPACYYTGCATAALYNSSSGVAVSHSVNGVTWSAPTALSAAEYNYIDFWSGACGVPSGEYAIPGSQTYSAAVYEGPNNHVYAAWTTVDPYYPGGHGTNGLLYCNTTVSPNVLEYGWAAPGGKIYYNLTVASSANGGSTWSTPAVVASNFLPTWEGIYLEPPTSNPSVTVGLPPADAVTIVYNDLSNATSAGLVPIGQVVSTTNGTSWHHPVDTGVLTNWVRDSSPDWFLNNTKPVITTDNWSTSFYRGNEYMVWGDNRSTPTTAGQSGYPSIGFSLNASGSSGWSRPVFVSLNNPNQTRYFMPTVSVTPKGVIWIEYDGSNLLNGAYHLYGVYSTNGGTTWSAQFTIADAASTPGNAPNAEFTAVSPVSVGTSAGDYILWIDCRAVDCSTGGNTTGYVALVNPIAISTTAANVINVTVSIGGLATTYALTGPTGTLNLGMDVNATVTVTVTGQLVTLNGSWIDDFASYSGAVNSMNNPVQFSFHSGNLLVHYTLVPGAVDRRNDLAARQRHEGPDPGARRGRPEPRRHPPGGPPPDLRVQPDGRRRCRVLREHHGAEVQRVEPARADDAAEDDDAARDARQGDRLDRRLGQPEERQGARPGQCRGLAGLPDGQLDRPLQRLEGLGQLLGQRDADRLQELQRVRHGLPRPRRTRRRSSARAPCGALGSRGPSTRRAPR